jgi:neutral ceramidase
VDITPPAGAFMAGFATDSPRIATGVRSRLWARCTVLWDNGTPNVLVTADVLGFGRGTHLAIRERMTSLGVAPADFILTATHTHSGPVLTEKLDPYISYGIGPAAHAKVTAATSSLVNSIMDLVKATLAGPRATCVLEYQVGQAPFGKNRVGLPYHEHDVPVLVARSPGGDPLAVVFSYGCHPVSAGKDTLFSSDYPGEAAAQIEAATGAFAHFILGAAGDQNPATPSGGPEKCGRTLATAVTAAMAAGGRPLRGKVRTAYAEAALPLDITNSPSNLAAVRAAYQTRTKDSTLPGYFRRHAEVMIRQLDTGSFESSVPLPFHRWAFDGDPGLQILLTGGEVVSGFGVNLRAHHGGSAQLLFGGYAGEVPAYVPSDELLRRPSSYEAGKFTDFPGIAGMSMCIYGCLGHFRGKPTATSPDGVEQIYLATARGLLAN